MVSYYVSLYCRTLKMEVVAGCNLNLLDHLFPRRFGVDVQFISNMMFDLGLVPLSMVGHWIVAT